MVEQDLGEATIVYEDRDGETEETTVQNEHVVYFQDHWIVRTGQDDEGRDQVRRIPHGRVYHVERTVQQFEEEVKTLRDQVQSMAEELRSRIPDVAGGLGSGGRGGRGGGGRGGGRVGRGGRGGDRGESRSGGQRGEEGGESVVHIDVEEGEGEQGGGGSSSSGGNSGGSEGGSHHGASGGGEDWDDEPGRE